MIKTYLIFVRGTTGGRPRHFSHKLFEMVETAWILDLLNISDHFAF